MFNLIIGKYRAIFTYKIFPHHTVPAFTQVHTTYFSPLKDICLLRDIPFQVISMFHISSSPEGHRLLQQNFKYYVHIVKEYCNHSH